MRQSSKHISNDFLVQRYQQGDKGALKLLIKQFHSRLELQIYSQTKNRDSVSDLVQESWYGIINGLENIEIKISFDVWALSIARRKAIDWIREQQRSRKKLKNILEENDSSEIKGEEEELETLLERRAKLRIAISRLPQSQQIVLSMFYLENYSIQEISEVIEISAGTVKSRLYTAREHLKEIFNTK